MQEDSWREAATRSSVYFSSFQKMGKAHESLKLEIMGRNEGCLRAKCREGP